MHEWARAFNNLNHAKLHLERARKKVGKRSKELKLESKRRHYAKAERECSKLLSVMDQAQKDIEGLIYTYGIKQDKELKHLRKLMNPPHKRMGKTKEWEGTKKEG